MVLETLRQYQAIIQSYTIARFEQVGRSLRLRLQITLIDDSTLYVRETIINGDKRKYAYHWQDKAGLLIIRWDNADHWQVDTKPHHKHVGYQDNVENSFERTLAQVLAVINQTMQDSS